MISKSSLWILLALTPLNFLFAEPGLETSSRLPRTNLLVFHNRAGKVLPVASKADWQKRREEVLRGMQSVMGELPKKRCPLDVKIESETDCGSYVRRFVTYASEPGARVTAFLLIPKVALQSKKKFPALLALHPTDMQVGHRTVVEEFPGKGYSPYAHELALRGFVVLAPSYPLMANYQPDLAALGYKSGTMKAIWDNIRGLDLLESLPFVQRGKFGALGHSLGGHNSIYTTVFDERIKVVVSSCGFDSYVDYKDGNIAGWCQERYMPRLADYKDRLTEIPFDFHEMIAALAPRVCFINAPTGDTNFKFRSVDEVVKAASQIYKLYGAEKNLWVEHPDCGHDFPEKIREEAYRILERELR